MRGASCEDVGSFEPVRQKQQAAVLEQDSCYAEELVELEGRTGDSRHSRLHSDCSPR